MSALITFALLILPLMLLLHVIKRCEGFGTSPGTLVQLAANHVPTASELYYPARSDNTTLIVIILILVLLLGVVLISK